MARKKDKSQSKLPQKTSMNLVMKDKKGPPPTTTLLVFLLLVVLVGCFAKFAVIDKLAQVSAANARVTDAEARLAAIEAQLVNYDEVAEKYTRYSYGYLNEEEAALADRIGLLELMEQRVMPQAQLDGCSIAGNTVVVRISMVTLEQVSTLVRGLEASPLVSSVSVYTADTENDQGSDNLVTAAMTISVHAASDGEVAQ